MYLKETLDQFASPANILKLLKKDLAFNKHCIQERIEKSDFVIQDKKRKYVYIIVEGFMKLVFEGIHKQNFIFFMKPGSLPFLPVYSEDVPGNTRVVALTEVVWWRVDFHFFKQMMELEDPRNYVMLHQLAETRRKLYFIAIQERLSARDSIYLSLNTMLDFGIRLSTNTMELPRFLTYQELANHANTSKSYASKVLIELREAGILDSKKKPWRINDLQRLKKLIDLESLQPYL
ncbi:Crp/Fnr family transcriptional regulator [Listeria ivanovii]|uniref:Putative transcriptional regulator n=1 Tax=Listeria ivanovii (strain ATCC BAA-678 / PAM 55) TaxID=881621 RepID=G2ZDW5_LISIP|nr:Crp/Fnr family transcriptional regulator [Listeria ivanovii]AHI56650.1 cyclic nucleotide-binding protein [Listeria ivanovii WSLC3009]AIS66067.1 cyclic nucleotide-binding protein [Listeria ivanovii subsp. ivanovii]MBC1760783.1 Crp/Fnr family transcriptional regulator [Listeria ivanovii]MCJ1716964.1 Crp/Fnr family transcriptional regulator [Listeria ivanovii]MCJ1722176.1 Crp/Fnr family transcriptional regulator [Listeria ivanovii]